MIGTIYRIRTAVGTEHIGRVQGSGGMLGGAGPRKTPHQAVDGLRMLRLAAAECIVASRAGMQGTVRIFPRFSALGNGPHVDVDVRGATVEIVDVDTDEAPSLGWPRERARLAWLVYPRVRVDSLKRGDVFFSRDGDAWRYIRKDGALSGVHHVETLDALREIEKTTFAGCAEVLLIPRK